MLTPWGLWIFQTDTLTAFTSAVRMVHRIHGTTAHLRPHTLHALASRFAHIDGAVLDIGKLADGSHHITMELADFGRGHNHLNVFSFVRKHRGPHTCGTYNLPAFAGMKLKVMDDASLRNIAQSHAVTRNKLSPFAGYDLHARLQSFGSKNIALIAIAIDNAGYAGGAVGIVLDGKNTTDNIHFFLNKIHRTVYALHAAAFVTDRNAALVVSANATLSPSGKRFEGSNTGKI